MGYDAELDNRVASDIRTVRTRRALFSFLSLFVVVSELSLSVALLASTLAADMQMAVVFSAVSTFVLTMDATLSIRERASCHNAALATLVGIRAQMRNTGTSVLWQEYYGVQGVRKISYLDAVLDVCAHEE